MKLKRKQTHIPEHYCYLNYADGSNHSPVCNHGEFRRIILITQWNPLNMKLKGLMNSVHFISEY